MLSRMRFSLATLLLALMLPNAGMAGAEEEQSNCLKKVKATGFPHRIKTVAELNAVRLWTQVTSKKDAKYGMWHNARQTELSCEQMARSVYYRCTASGKPCLNELAEKAER